jgi:hypothetical protein
MWSTPWPGNAGIARDGDAPLGVIALIGRGSSFSVSLLARRDALQRLLKTLLVPLWDMAHAGAGLDLVDAIIALVPIVELAYPLTHESPNLIVNALTEVVR